LAGLAASFVLLYSFYSQPIKPIANYDASVIPVMYGLKSNCICLGCS